MGSCLGSISERFAASCAVCLLEIVERCRMVFRSYTKEESMTLFARNSLNLLYLSFKAFDESIILPAKENSTYCFLCLSWIVFSLLCLVSVFSIFLGLIPIEYLFENFGSSGCSFLVVCVIFSS